MAGKTDWHADRVLNILRFTSVTATATTYIALFTAAPTDAYTDASPTGTEVSYSGSTPADRASIAFDAPGAGTDRQVANTSDVSWTSWGGTSDTIVAAGLFDNTVASTLDNLMYWATITNRTILVGETATFAAGAVTVDET